MNTTAVWTVAGLEVRQRIRSTRWKRTLVILFLLVSALVFGSLYLTIASGEEYSEWAGLLFDLTLAVVLFLGLAAAPTLSAMSINGDRRDATLALLQATPITSLELALGKWLGSWLASLALIGVATPYLIWGMVTSPATVVGCLLGVVATALLLACYCALGLGFSSLTARPAASAMLTQAAVLFVLIGLPIAFAMTIPMVMSTHQVQRAVSAGSYLSPSEAECRLTTRDETFVHTDRTWWLLAPNPVLVVADAVSVGLSGGSLSGPSQFVAEGGSLARATPYIVDQSCGDRFAMRDAERAHDRAYMGHTWYIGLIVNIALGAWGLWIAVRRLRVPARRLPKGVRVA